MKKKIISFAVIIAILVSLVSLSSCSVQKKKEVTINVKVPIIAMDTENIIDNDVTDAYMFLKKVAQSFSKQYEYADVDINVVRFESSKADREITDSFETENATDVLFERYLNMSSYIYTGRVVPLDDIITQEMKNDISKFYWDISKKDGKTYMMPFFSSQNVLCYNKDLFRQAGLEEFISDKDEIQSWTIDEWDTILEALRDSLPDTSYPMMMYARSKEGDTHIMMLLRSRQGEFFDEDGYFNLNTPKGIESLKKMREFSEMEIFPQNAESLLLLDNYSMFTNGQLAIYTANISTESRFRNAGIDIGFVNFPSSDYDEGYYTIYFSGFEVFDNGDEDKIKVSKDFIRYIYDSEWIVYSAGMIPASKKTAEKYSQDLKSAQKYINNNGVVVNFTDNNPNWRGVRSVFYKHIQDLLYGDKTVETIAEEIDSDCNAAIREGYKNARFHE